MSTQGIFLSKDGKKFGPYTGDQVEAMRSSGEIYGYAWMWDPSNPKWQAIEPPPPPPGTPDEMDSIPEPPRAAPAAKQPPLRAVPRVAEVQGTIEALCHDNCNIVSGRLHEISSMGAKLVSVGQQSPSFSKASAVTLNLLDPRTGKSINVRGRVANIFQSATDSKTQGLRAGRQWTYVIQWNTDVEALTRIAG